MKVRHFAIILIVLLTACAPQATVSDRVIPGSNNPPGANLQPGEIVNFAELLVGFLLVAALVSLVTRRLKIPYTIGLVIVGLGLSFFGQALIRPISPEIILVLLLPPLVFEAVLGTNIHELRRALAPVMILAVPGVVLTTLLVGGLLALGARLPLPYALVFGALIAPTDPVAVTALFRSIGAPRRLQAVFEGESLLNDGTAIVLFKLMLLIAATGQVNVGSGLLQFFFVAGGGILVGAAIGALFSLVLNRMDDHIVETTLSVVLAYGAYLLAEFVFGVSGVLAVVAAGGVVSALSTPRASPTARIFVANFWEYAAFLANSFIFLTIGVQTKIQLLLQNVIWILWSILAVLVARLIVVWGLHFMRRSSIQRTRIPVSWNAILFWGGLRGAVSLALALSLSFDLQYREQIQAMAFGVVLFTLLVQGSTLASLANRLGLVKRSPQRLQFEQRQARVTGLRAAATRMEDLGRQGLVGQAVVETLLQAIRTRIDQVDQEERDALQNDPSVRQRALADAWREALRAQRSAITGLYQDAILSDEVYSQMVAEVDGMLEGEEPPWPELREALGDSDQKEE
jgi:monovalent cation:H+ antiporter, CPA1 family